MTVPVGICCLGVKFAGMNSGIIPLGGARDLILLSHTGLTEIRVLLFCKHLYQLFNLNNINNPLRFMILSLSILYL